MLCMLPRWKVRNTRTFFQLKQDLLSAQTGVAYMPPLLCVMKCSKASVTVSMLDALACIGEDALGSDHARHAMH